MNKQIKKLEAEVEALWQLTMRACGRFAFLKPMMRNKVLLRRIRREQRDKGFARVRNWLLWGLVLELHKISSDDDKRTPSIKTITLKLKDAGLRKQLEDTYAKAIVTWKRRSSELSSTVFIQSIFGVPKQCCRRSQSEVTGQFATNGLRITSYRKMDPIFSTLKLRK
jgi:hypothetical protein